MGARLRRRVAYFGNRHGVCGAPPRETDGYVLSNYDSPLNRETKSNQLYIDLLFQSIDYACFFTLYLMLADDLRAVAARMGLACELSEQEGVSCMRAVAARAGVACELSTRGVS